MGNIEGKSLYRFDNASALFLFKAGAHEGVLHRPLRFQAHLVGDGQIFDADCQIIWHHNG